MMELAGQRKADHAGPGMFDRHPYVDLYDLLDRIAASPKLGEDVHSTAVEVMEAVDGMVLASFGMARYD